MTKQAHEKWLISLVIREMQIETTMRYHFIPTRMAVEEKGKVLSVVNLEPSCVVFGSVKWYSCCGNQLGSSSKESARDSVIPFLAYTQKNWKQVFKQIVLCLCF